MSEIPDSVKKCVAILRAAASDTEKFAALFMVTKLVKSSDCTTQSKKMILEAIGFKFLKRLLLSPDVATDCPPTVYKSVALSVLSSFCSEPELATHPDILTNVPVFLEIIQQADDDDEDLDDNLMAINEAYSCLHFIAATDAGQKALLDVGAVTKMCEIYSHQSFQTDKALNILVVLVNRFGPLAWDSNVKSFHAIMSKIALDFETDHSERKFELCSILNALLFSCCRSEVMRTASEESWPGSIHKGLNDILKSKIGKNQRDPALKLTSVMIELCGVEWTLTDEDNPRQFFLLLVQLCSVEVRMQLEDKQMKQIMANADLITACFIILELSIAHIAQDTLDLEQKEKQTLYTALKGAFSAVISTLTKVSKDFTKNKDSMSSQERVFITAMVRVLGAWLAQETTAMRNAVYAILPFMLTLANDTFYACRDRKIRARNTEERAKAGNDVGSPMEVDADPLGEVDVLRLLLPALCHLTVEEKARKIMLDVKEEEVFYESLVFHWSNVQIKRPKIPKAERLKMKSIPEPEYTFDQLDQMKDSRTAMISLCNIFMNITVLEAKLAEESPTFATLLKFIFNNITDLKDTPENLVLSGNLAILGLLLLKQQAKRMKKNDFAICRFIQTTIRFLWDAYCVDESVDATSLSVSMKYKEHWSELMELWFLGMQTMSAVLALIPWVSEFAMESGWAEGIIDMLNNVRKGSLPSNTKSAYEDFLCNLVEANQSVVKVLEDHGALNVCRTHHFMELGKKLFGPLPGRHRSLEDFDRQEIQKVIKAIMFQNWQRFTSPVQSILVKKYGFSTEAAYNATQNFLKSFRKCPENPEFPLHDWRHMLWKKSLGENHTEISGEVYSQWLNLRYKYIAPLPEVISLLECLRRNYWLCIITNGPSNSQWEKVKRLRLSQYFELILVSGDLKWEKPDKNIFLMACSHLGVTPEECLMVGDKLETDIRGGIEAGLGGTVWVLPGGNASWEYEAGKRLDVVADCVIDDVTDLKCLLASRGESGYFGSRGGPWCLRGSEVDLEDGNSNGSDGS